MQPTTAPAAEPVGADAASLEPVDPPLTVPRGLVLTAGVLLIAGLFFPQRQVLDAVAAAGGSASAPGFVLLRVLLVCSGVLLTAVARTGIGTRSTLIQHEPGTGTGVRRSWEPVALGVLLVLAVALRLPELGAGLWHDEIATLLQQVRQPFVSVLTSFESQNNHPLYSILAKLSIGILGDSPSALRVPSVLFGLGGIAAVYWFGVQIGRRVEALLAAALLAVSYHHIWFSQNARGYTALLFFATIGTGLLVRLCSDRLGSARPTAFAYAAVMTLAVYAHLTAGLIVAAHFLVWAIAVARIGQWRSAWRSAPALGFVLAGIFSLTLYAPGLAHIAADVGGSGPPLEVEWKNPLWMLAETVSGLARGLPGGVVTLIVAAAAPLAGLLSHAARSRLVTALMITPPVLTALVMIATGHNLWPRFFFFAAGFALLILVRGVFVIAGRVWPARADALGVAAALLVIAASAVLAPAAWGPKQDYAGALAYVEQERAPRDAVAAAGIAAFTYQNYLDTDFATVASAGDLTALRADHERVWLIYAMPELIEARNPELWSMIQRDFRQAVLFPGTLAGGTIHVMVTE